MLNLKICLITKKKNYFRVFSPRKLLSNCLQNAEKVLKRYIRFLIGGFAAGNVRDQLGLPVLEASSLRFQIFGCKYVCVCVCVYGCMGVCM